MDCNKNIFTVVNAEKAPLNAFGYFCNNIHDLKRAIEEKRTFMKVMYCRLESVLKDTEEKRFSTMYGNFSLFYPINDSYEAKRC